MFVPDDGLVDGPPSTIAVSWLLSFSVSDSSAATETEGKVRCRILFIQSACTDRTF